MAATLRRCANCRKRSVAATILQDYSTELEHDGRPYTVTAHDFPALQCRDCGALVFTDASHEELTDALRKAAGLLRPGEIRAAREKLGLTQQQLADALRISVFTLSRWETGGQIQQRAMDAFLRVFFACPEARATLGVSRPQDVSQTIALSEPTTLLMSVPARQAEVAPSGPPVPLKSPYTTLPEWPETIASLPKSKRDGSITAVENVSRTKKCTSENSEV